jgi:hypothetical protein
MVVVVLVMLLLALDTHDAAAALVVRRVVHSAGRLMSSAPQRRQRSRIHAGLLQVPTNRCRGLVAAARRKQAIQLLRDSGHALLQRPD